MMLDGFALCADVVSGLSVCVCMRARVGGPYAFVWLIHTGVAANEQSSVEEVWETQTGDAWGSLTTHTHTHTHTLTTDTQCYVFYTPSPRGHTYTHTHTDSTESPHTHTHMLTYIYSVTLACD